jgi:UDP-N-acetylglucosamine 2-epimerase (non-hydrolysing)
LSAIDAVSAPFIQLIVGARPNFMKAAPVVEALRRRHPNWRVELLHTGQHYDEKMSDLFFRELGMPEPSVNLGVGSGTPAVQTARIMMALEEIFVRERPDIVVVFGDVNSTLAAALVATKLEIAVAHVEAGLRSFDRTMPEEINRLVTDAIADMLFITEESARTNLMREGAPEEKVFFVGNTMIDTLLKHAARAKALGVAQRFGLEKGRFAVATLHRPSNVDDPGSLRRVAAAFTRLADDGVPIVFPVHPRTVARLRDFGLLAEFERRPRVMLVEPMGYLDFLGLMSEAGVILTDSGGIQEESLILGVPCITLRWNTERPVTLNGGANVLVGNDPERIISHALTVLRGERTVSAAPPPLWDGKASERIAEALADFLLRRAASRESAADNHIEGVGR